MLIKILVDVFFRYELGFTNISICAILFANVSVNIQTHKFRQILRMKVQNFLELHNFLLFTCPLYGKGNNL